MKIDISQLESSEISHWRSTPVSHDLGQADLFDGAKLAFESSILL